MFRQENIEETEEPNGINPEDINLDDQTSEDSGWESDEVKDLTSAKEIDSNNNSQRISSPTTSTRNVEPSHKKENIIVIDAQMNSHSITSNDGTNESFGNDETLHLNQISNLHMHHKPSDLTHQQPWPSPVNNDHNHTQPDKSLKA